MERLFSFQVMYKSQFHKIDPYDWFCGPGSHIYIYIYNIFIYRFFLYTVTTSPGLLYRMLRKAGSIKCVDQCSAVNSAWPRSAHPGLKAAAFPVTPQWGQTQAITPLSLCSRFTSSRWPHSAFCSHGRRAKTSSVPPNEGVKAALRWQTGTEQSRTEQEPLLSRRSQ